MQKLDWVKELDREELGELPEVYQAVAEVIGVENALKLSESLGGTYLYFPKIDKLLIAARDRRIKKEFDGTNHKELAMKYGLSETWIRQIVNGGDDRQKTRFL